MGAFQSLSFKKKIMLMIIGACSLCAFVAIGGFLHFNEKELANGIINKERTIHTQLSAATEFVAKQGGLPAVIDRMRAKYKDPEQLSETDKREILNQVPIYAAMVIGKTNSEKDRYKFRVFSDEPRRKENMATAEELAILKKFETEKDLTEHVTNDGKVITMFRPVHLKESQGCLTCHGEPNTSPWGNGKDILGFKMENWRDGKLHGVFAISQSIDEVAKASTGGALITPAGWLIFAIGLGALVAVMFGMIMIRAPIDTLNQVAAVLAQSSEEVDGAAKQIATSAQGLSQATTQQAASLEETAASIEEMNAMVKKNSENASRSSENSEQCRTQAEHGKEVVEQMIHAMAAIDQSNNDIMTQVNQSNAEMAEIVRVIQEIGAKTKVINDIVFQTKLLSFNASVEAARAGEHGKGFAVVAEEVGNLAQMSGNASKEISSMLEGSISKVEAIVRNTQTRVEELTATGKSKVDAGSAVARQCGEVLDLIVQNVRQVSEMASEISTASREQALGVNELTKAMNELDQATQQNAATSSESARSAESLSSQAESLQDAVQQLMSVIQGTSHSSRTEGRLLQFSPGESQIPHAELPTRKMNVAVGDHDVPSHDG